MTAQEIVLDEFGCYYLGDEIPSVGAEFAAKEVPRRAAQSVKRMARKTDADGRLLLVALLGVLRDDRQHPLHKKIAESTLIWWADDDESWASFQALTAAMIAGLLSS